MARWICPYCTHVSTVAPITVGHNFSCPSCKEESTVIDADAEAIERLKCEKAAGEAAGSGLRSVTVCTLFLGVGLALTGFMSLYVMLSGAFLPGAMSFLTIVFIACIVSPLLEAINEIHRCRRLLEELVKRQ